MQQRRLDSKRRAVSAGDDAEADSSSASGSPSSAVPELERRSMEVRASCFDRGDARAGLRPVTSDVQI